MAEKQGPESRTWRRRHSRSRAGVASKAARAGLIAAGLVLVFSLAASTALQRGGTPLSRGLAPALTSIDMISSAVGWATTRSRVVRTTDGGRRWTDVSPVTSFEARPGPTAFLSATVAWVGYWSPMRPEGGSQTFATIIFRTSDGGQTWQAGDSIPPEAMVMGGIEQLAFVDAQHGWLLRSGSDGLGGRGAALYRTSDGGKQWGERFAGRALGSPVAGGWSGFPVTCRDLWIRFIDASNGWASGDCGRGPVSVFLTHDGGELWWQKQLPMGLCSTGCLPELAYLGSNGEIVVTVRYPDTWSGKVFDRPDTILYSSHDEGQSWQARRFPTGRVGPVTFVEAKVGWAMVDGFIYGTHDGGAHWTRLSSTALGVDTAVVDFVDARTGWALGSLSRPAPTLARTAAGGTDWRSLDYVWKPVVGFACRLPFIPQPNDPDRAQAGYIAFPDGQLVNEPSGEFVPQGNLLTSVALPHLSGISGPSFYDRPYSRWLPATAEAVVPDGSSYAYAISTDTGYPSSNRQSELHIVSVASGADHVVSLPGLDPYLAWAVAHYDQRGVYLYQQRWEAEATAERWLLDTSTERLDKVSDAPTLTTAPGWTTDLDPNDPTPVVSGYDGSPLPDRLIKAGNSAVVWFYQPGKFVNLLGTGPDGHPLVVVGTGLSSEDHFELWLVQAPGAAKRIFTGAELLGLQPGVTDSYGLWIGSSEGLYLYEPKGGFRRVARVAGQVAGACY